MTSTLAETRLWDPDLYAGGIPHELFARLRVEDPVHWQDEPDGSGFWAVMRHADVREVNRDAETYSSARGGYLLEDHPEEHLEMFRMQMIGMDAPEHTRNRRMINRGFTPRRIDAMDSHLRDLARGIVDNIADKGEVDFVSEVAAELPLLVICELMGVPVEDRARIFELTNSLIGFDDPDFQTTPEAGQEAMAEMYLYAHGLVADRRDNPRDDIVSTLVHKEVDGERLSEAEIDVFFLLLAVAGNETTRNATAQGMHALLTYPDQLAVLEADRSLLASTATEEILRWATPVIQFRRTATRDTELGGKHIAAGDKVVMYYSSANRDEAVFEDPHRFDVRRSPNDHLAFGGGGPHYCLGANLARMELRILFDELLARLTNFELAGEVRLLRSNFINGIKELPVSFSVR